MVIRSFPHMLPFDKKSFHSISLRHFFFFFLQNLHNKVRYWELMQNTIGHSSLVFVQYKQAQTLLLNLY